MSRRTAFSLVEIIVVLLIIVIATGIILPSADSMYRNARVQAGVDGVRSALLMARTRAIEDGRDYRVGILPGGVAFRVAPDSPEFWIGSGRGNPVAPGVTPPYVMAANVVGGVRFSSGPGGTAAPTPVQPAGGSALGQNNVDPPAETIDASNFETLVTFFADGTAESDLDITFQLGSARGLTLSLRALTGVSTVRPQAIPAVGGNQP